MRKSNSAIRVLLTLCIPNTMSIISARNNRKRKCAVTDAQCKTSESPLKYAATHRMPFPPSLKQTRIYLMDDHGILRHCVTSSLAARRKEIHYGCAFQSSSLDPLPTDLLKNVIDVLLPCITFPINRSLMSGDFPASLKHGLAAPLFKRSDLDHEV